MIFHCVFFLKPLFSSIIVSIPALVKPSLNAMELWNGPNPNNIRKDCIENVVRVGKSR